jgi:SH3-like domain-containing protein
MKERKVIKMTESEALALLVSIEEAEVGYLEKKSNASLDSKTANAGYNNWTKYWRDIATWTGQNYQQEAWCAAFQYWSFVKAFGYEMANKLLKHHPFISSIKIVELFNKDKQVYTTPKAGDIVSFHNGTRFYHIAFVYKVDSTYFYTIEGNTSSGTAVVANGGGVYKKKYVIKNKTSGTRFCRIDWSLLKNVKSSSTTKTTTSTTSSTSSSSSTSTDVKTNFKVKITVSSLNVRKSASKDSSQVTFVKKGEEVKITKVNKDGSWGYTEDKKGWISLNSSYVTVVSTTLKTTTALNCRKESNAKATLIKTYKADTSVTITKLNSEKTWGYVEKDKGWISLAYTKF